MIKVLKQRLKQNARFLIRTLTGYWLHKKKYLPTGTDLFLDLENLSKNDFKIVFDVGANVGQTATTYAINFPKARTFSFEQVKASYNKLKENTFGLKNVKCFNIALGSKLSRRNLVLNPDPTCVKNSLKPNLENKDVDADSQLIEIDTIDNFIVEQKLDSIDFLKIDTEGWEIEVLKGGLKTITQNKIKLILCEVGFTVENQRNTPFNELNDFLNDNNFVFYGLYDISLIQLKKYTHYANALYVNREYLKEVM
jgi:FkbM family methyltransferase